MLDWFCVKKVFLLACCLFLWAVPTIAQETETHFLQQLRRLQLFPEAERYTREQLARADLPATAQVEFTLEQMRTLAMHALASSGEARESLWMQARLVAKDFSNKQPSHPRLVLIRVQDALTLQALGDQQRREAESLSDAAPLLTLASGTLRAAEKSLADIAQQLAKEIPQRRNQPVKEGELSVEELTRLKLQVEWQLAKTSWSRAFCYVAESRDRKALLLSTLESLETAVARINANDELTGQLRILQMACLRELKRYDEALQVWQWLDSDVQPLAIRREAFAEALRTQAMLPEAATALKWLEDAKYQPLLQTRDPELELAKLELVLRLARLAAEQKQTAELSKWQKAATQLAGNMERMHGHYWGRRADQLLAALAGGSAAAANASVELLARQADANYLQRKYDEAAQLYEQAAQAAHTAGQADREFDLRYKSALLAQERKQYDIAAARLDRLAIAFKDHAQAAEAHLVACWNKAQQAREQPAVAPSYAAMLEEHVTRWPNAASAAQAQLWLGNWRQSQAEFAPAFTAYAAVPRESPHFLAAITGAANCARGELKRLLESNQNVEAAARQYLEYFQLNLPEAKATTLGPAERVAILVSAELFVQALPGGCSSAEKMLTVALQKLPVDDAEWETQAKAWYVITLAGQANRAEEAVKQLQANASSPQQLLTMLDRLSTIATRSSATQRAAIATVQVAVLDKLEQNTASLTASQKIELRTVRAQALALIGNRAGALAAYEQLAKDDARNGAIQEAYAELLTAGKDAASAEAALGKWRQIAAKSAPRQERWYKAKYNVAALLIRLEKKPDAATLVQFLLETPPGIEDAQWKARFEKLWEESRK
jgi:hypothetical protein